MAASSNQRIPKLHESYTTYLYWHFALVFLVPLVVGFVAQTGRLLNLRKHQLSRDPLL